MQNDILIDWIAKNILELTYIQITKKTPLSPHLKISFFDAFALLALWTKNGVTSAQHLSNLFSAWIPKVDNL